MTRSWRRQSTSIGASGLFGIRQRGAGPDSWAWVHMAPFSVGGNAPNIVVDFRDIEDPWWKSGMEWDFVQLCGVE